MIKSQTDLNQKLVSENTARDAENTKLKASSRTRLTKIPKRKLNPGPNPNEQAECERLANANIELQTRKTSLESSMADRRP